MHGGPGGGGHRCTEVRVGALLKARAPVLARAATVDEGTPTSPIPIFLIFFLFLYFFFIFLLPRASWQERAPASPP